MLGFWSNKHMTAILLFKYRDFSARSLTALSTNKMFFAAPSLFNDPFDCSFVPYKATTLEQIMVDFEEPVKSLHNFSRSEAREYIKCCFCTNRNQFIGDMREAFKNVVLRGFGVYCLSHIDNDILMWSHYTDGHKGFCLVFNRTEDNFLSDAKEVNYPEDDKYPDLIWPKSIEGFVQFATTIVLTKSKHWKYEEEWRKIDRPDSQKTTESYLGHEVEYSNDMLAGIIFGAKMPHEHRKVIKQLTADKGVIFKEAKISPTHFRVEIFPCDC